MRSNRFLLVTTLSLLSLGSIALYAYTQSEPAKKAPLISIPMPLDAPRPVPAPVKPLPIPRSVPQLPPNIAIPLKIEGTVKIQGKVATTTTVIKLKHAPAQQMSDLLIEFYGSEFEMRIVVAPWNNAIVLQASAPATATIRAMIDDLDTTFEGDHNPSEMQLIQPGLGGLGGG